MLVHDFKLSHNQTKRLLQTLKDEQFRDSYLKDGVTLKSHDQCRSLLRKFQPDDSTWEELQIQLHGQVVKAWRTPLLPILQQLIAPSSRSSQFQCGGQYNDEVFDEPHHGRNWRDAEQHIQKTHGPSSRLLALQVNTDAADVTVTGIKVKPIYLSVLNYPYSERIKRICTVGYIDASLAEHGEDWGSEECKQFKQEYHAVVIQRLLQKPLKQLWEQGIKVEDMPDITWHPDIISFIADNPEQSLLFGTYAAHNAKCKCQRCLRETSQMGIVFSTMAKRRTEASQKAIQQSIIQHLKNGEVAAAHQLMKENSTSAVAAPLWRLSRGLDCYRLSPTEILHTFDLGLTRKLFEHLSTLPAKLVRIMHGRMQGMPRIANFYLPLGDNLFTTQAHLSAADYRHAACVLPDVVAGLVDEAVEDAINIWARLQTAVSGRLLPIDAARGSRSPGMTADVVKRLIPSLAKKLVGKLGEFLKPSALHSVKIHHVLEHLSEDIQDHGACRHSSAECYEHQHVPTKAIVRSSGMQRHDNRFMTAVTEIHVDNASAEALRAVAGAQGVALEPPAGRVNDTTWQRVHKGAGEHQLQEEKHRLSLTVLAGATSASVPVAQHVVDTSISMRADQPPLQFLQRRLQSRVNADLEPPAADGTLSRDNKRRRVAAPATSAEQPIVGDIIKVHTQVTLAARARHTPGDNAELQTARADPSYHSKPWYSYVLLDLEDKGHSQQWGQLVLLFSASVQPKRFAVASQQQFAYVRLLQRTSKPKDQRDTVAQLGSKRLSWVAAEDKEDGYEVVQLSSIACRQYLIPAWAHTDCDFHNSVLLEHLKDM